MSFLSLRHPREFRHIRTEVICDILGVPKIMGGYPITRTIVDWGLYWGPPTWGILYFKASLLKILVPGFCVGRLPVLI